MPIIIDKSKCPQNHPCPAAAACPVSALVQDGYDAPSIDLEKCLDCGKCAGICLMGALTQNS